MENCLSDLNLNSEEHVFYALRGEGIDVLSLPWV